MSSYPFCDVVAPDLLFENHLQSFEQLTEKCFKYTVTTKEVKDMFVALDQENLDRETKFRFVLQHVHSSIQANIKLWDQFKKVGTKLSESSKCVHEAMMYELQEYYGITVAEVETDVVRDAEELECQEKFSVFSLTNLLTEGCLKWKEIGVALQLSDHVIEECGKKGGTNDALCLHYVLSSWIDRSEKEFSTDHEEVSALIKELRLALCTDIVGLSRLSRCLIGRFQPKRKKIQMYETLYQYYDSSAFEPRSTIVDDNDDSAPQIIFQSGDTIVDAGKSTLLEIQVSHTNNCTYQWSKDNRDLSEGLDFSSTTSNILYINKADAGTQGKYRCCVNQSDYCEEIIVTVKMCITKHAREFPYKVGLDSLWPPKGKYHPFIHVICSSSTSNEVIIKEINKNYSSVQSAHLRPSDVLNFNDVFCKYVETAFIWLECSRNETESLAEKIYNGLRIQPKLLDGTLWCFKIEADESCSLYELLCQCYSSHNDKKYFEDILNSCEGQQACFIIKNFEHSTYDKRDKSILYIYQLMYKHVLPLAMIIVITPRDHS